MVGKGPSALVSEKSIELQGKEQKHKLQKPHRVSNLPPTTWSWTRAGAVTWQSGSDTTTQSLGSVQRRGCREGQGQAEGRGFHSWALRPLGTLHTPQEVEESCWEESSWVKETATGHPLVAVLSGAQLAVTLLCTWSFAWGTSVWAHIWEPPM